MMTRFGDGDVVLILESPPGVTHPELIGNLGVVQGTALYVIHTEGTRAGPRGWWYYPHQLEVLGDVRPIEGPA